MIEVDTAWYECVVASFCSEVVNGDAQVVFPKEPVKGFSLEGQVSAVLCGVVGGAEHHNGAYSFDRLLVERSFCSASFIPSFAAYGAEMVAAESICEEEFTGVFSDIEVFFITVGPSCDE